MKFVRMFAAASACATVVAGAAVASPAAGAARPDAARGDGPVHVTTAGSTAFAARLARALPRPPAVSGLAAYQDGERVTVSWHNPAAAAFERVVVRYRAGHRAPVGPRHGTPVPVRGSHSSTAVLRNLAPNTAYAAAVWTLAAGRPSTRSTLTFRTTGRPPGAPAADSVLAGVVTDAAGAPLRGVAVVVGPRFGGYYGRQLRRTVTDDRGRYSLRVPHGQHGILFDGSRASGGASDTTGYVGAETLVRVAPREHAVLDRTLGAGAALRGRVVDSAGNPVAGVRIAPSFPLPFVNVDTSNDDFAFFESVTAATPRTGPGGWFRLTGLPADALTVCGRVPRDAARSACSDQPVLTPAGSTGNAGVITLRDSAAGGTGTLSGAVRDTQGNPVRGATIYLEAGQFPPSFRLGHTDAAGRFRLTGLRPGRYGVCAMTPPLPRPRHHTGLLPKCSYGHVVVAGRVTRARLALPDAAAVSGTVTSVGGRPLPGADVYVENLDR